MNMIHIAFFQYVYIFRINKVLLSAEFYAEINFCIRSL